MVAGEINKFEETQQHTRLIKHRAPIKDFICPPYYLTGQPFNLFDFRSWDLGLVWVLPPWQISHVSTRLQQPTCNNRRNNSRTCRLNATISPNRKSWMLRLQETACPTCWTQAMNRTWVCISRSLVCQTHGFKSLISLVYLCFQSLCGNSSNGVLIDVLGQSSSQNSFASSIVKEIKVEANFAELEVPDLVAGAVLGPKAKTLVEIQKKSGCKVEVHKRGEQTQAAEGFRRIRSFFYPLSCLTDCLVDLVSLVNIHTSSVHHKPLHFSLTGDDNAISAARDLINFVINNEQARRQSNNNAGSRAGFCIRSRSFILSSCTLNRHQSTICSRSINNVVVSSLINLITVVLGCGGVVRIRRVILSDRTQPWGF